MSVNSQELKDFSKRLKTLTSGEIDDFIDHATNNITGRILRKVIKYEFDHKVTGNLVRGYRATPVKRDGKVRKAQIYNPVEYASYVEYGHRLRRKTDKGNLLTGWWEGRHSLSRSAREVAQDTDKILSKELERFIRSKLNGS